MRINQELSDKYAIGISLLCSFNCLFLPSILILSSSYLAAQIDTELVHGLILLIAIPLSIFALSLGLKNHNEKSFFFLGLFGLALMAGGFFFGSVVGEFGEKFLTFFGSLVGVFGHYKNYKACRDQDCDCHDKTAI